MSTTLAGTARSTRTITATPAPDVRRPRGAAPLARPRPAGPIAAPRRVAVPSRRASASAACRVVSPAARRSGMVLKLKVVAVAVVALVGVGASAAEFASWAQPDPAVEFVAGHPAWAHVTGR